MSTTLKPLMEPMLDGVHSTKVATTMATISKVAATKVRGARLGYMLTTYQVTKSSTMGLQQAFLLSSKPSSPSLVASTLVVVRQS